MIAWAAKGTAGERHLACERCDATAEANVTGWRGEVVNPGTASEALVAVYCPSCWQRLFGQRGIARRRTSS